MTSASAILEYMHARAAAYTVYNNTYTRRTRAHVRMLGCSLAKPDPTARAGGSGVLSIRDFVPLECNALRNTCELTDGHKTL